MYARYQADQYDISTNIWSDSSSNNRHVSSASITNTGLTKESYISNGKQFNVIHGTTSTKISFMCSALTSYTVFHVVRYTGVGDLKRIMADDMSCGDYSNWFSGHWNGYTGVAYHDGEFLTSSSSDLHGTNWVVSSDSYQIYRSNYSCWF